MSLLNVLLTCFSGLNCYDRKWYKRKNHWQSPSHHYIINLVMQMRRRREVAWFIVQSEWRTVRASQSEFMWITLYQQRTEHRLLYADILGLKSLLCISIVLIWFHFILYIKFVSRGAVSCTTDSIWVTDKTVIRVVPRTIICSSWTFSLGRTFLCYRKLFVSYNIKSAPWGCAFRSSTKESQATLCFLKIAHIQYILEK